MIAVILTSIMVTIILRARNCFENEILKTINCDEMEINQRCVAFCERCISAFCHSCAHRYPSVSWHRYSRHKFSYFNVKTLNYRCAYYHRHITKLYFHHRLLWSSIGYERLYKTTDYRSKGSLMLDNWKKIKIFINQLKIRIII